MCIINCNSKYTILLYYIIRHYYETFYFSIQNNLNFKKIRREDNGNWKYKINENLIFPYKILPPSIIIILFIFFIPKYKSFCNLVDSFIIYFPNISLIL